MPANNTYSKFVQEVKQQILESRYNAARLVNKKLLLLYYNIGKMLHEKIKEAKWGDKVLQNISADLQKELPGLRGFSAQNIKKMRIFYEAYPMLLQHKIGSSTTNQLADKNNANKNKERSTIGSSATNQFEYAQKDIFYLLSFTHHFLLIPEKALLKASDVCAIFQVSKPTLYDWLKQNKLRSFKIKSRRYFLRSDIGAMIRQETTTVSPKFDVQ
jgi:predicted DNA-binding transcriptional regulator AlpA